ncbi:endopeptidase La [Candidatus Mycoplasma mahonii]|uniref:endopeptidase La n=1 Tax=Candidatus Mycoplasma mahonii TaxID=3004105 RepID=UPI0026ED387E|nr:endopeptidase La [Candidatus Mycoplasma mahonii]WKX02613.1 endopeptidase La [Candidatus Mycoplasma mahonii]
MKYTVVPTRGVIVFPGHSSVVEAGRRGSLNAVDLSVLQYESKLVIISQKDPIKPFVENEEDLYKVGTLVSIKVEKKSENGSKSISMYGIKRVKIKSIEITDNLIEADVVELASKSVSSEDEQKVVDLISQKMQNIMSSMAPMPKDVLSSLATGITAGELTDLVAHYVPFKFSDKQEILESFVLYKRLELVNGLLISKTKEREVDHSVDMKVKKTLDDQQREFLLREKQKAIKEELGELSSKDSEIDEWNKKLQDKKYPHNVRDVVLQEMRRYESMPSISAEAHVSKGYIEWIMKLPWDTYSEDLSDLRKAQKVLDSNHYGLKEVKSRIIEHLAVKIKTNSHSSPILTLVGPPGVGKTSLAKSISQTLGREMIKVSLGGVKDESEIRGHRRTYVGAMPGKIIQAINRAKTSNPIILLDEIDKMSSDYKGDPTSAMLEVLDPEQNKKFQDNYIELEYDLSNVMFLATANYIDQIPNPLMDRVELIRLNQYTTDEKIEIAKRHIISDVIKENGLTKNLFNISDATIEYVINKYTLEAGVRGLKRTLSKLARKIVVLKLNGDVKSSYVITIEKAKKLLGKEKVTKEVLKGKSEVGLTNGMYFSNVGGGILPIEVKTYASKAGNIILTGSIKDVMKESLTIAIAYIRSNAKKFGIKFDFEKNVIQVHVPEGATPKDGPSAGIAFTTAVLSALLGKPVKRDIALTGEITLRGKVLEIGGLKEKTIGAVEAGVKIIFIPETNKKDISDLSKKVKEIAKIITVSKYEDVYNKIFA